MDKQIKKKFWNRQRILLTLGGVLFASFAAYSLLFADRRSTLNAEKDKMTISQVTNGTFDEFIVVTGVVMPLRIIRLDAIVGGYVKEKVVDGGNVVKQGQTILKLENQNLKLNFLQSETEASRLVNDLQNTRQRLKVEKFTIRKNMSDLDFLTDQAKDLYERNKKLYNDKVIPEADYLKAKRDYEKLVSQKEIDVESQRYQEENAAMQIKQLEGTLERTQRNVQLWRETLENLVVKAPVSGLLSSIDVEVGSNISQGQNIGQIDDLDGFKLRVDIDEHYNGRIFTGLGGTFEFSGKEYPLQITKIYPEIRNGRFSVDMVFAKGVPEGIKRGQSSPIRLELGKATKAVLLPVGGFFSDTGGNWVYVVDKSGGKAVKRKITLGRKNPEFFEVLEGLEVGDQVITSSYENFGDNEVLQLK